MQLDLMYTLRLNAKQNIKNNKILSDDDSDAIYSVDFHMDDYDCSTNVEHILNSEKYHQELAEVSPEDIAAVEDDLRAWLERQTLNNNLILKDNCVVYVAFEFKPSGIKFCLLKTGV